LSIEGVAATLNPADGTWQVIAGESAFDLRPWRWGERRRLLAACATGGHFDRDAFLSGLVALLYDPAPPKELTPLFSLVALELMAGAASEAAMPLAEAERDLARRYGWSPGMLETERADDLDRLLAETAHTPPAPLGGAGWRSIRFDTPTRRAAP
jgi:hypothetical protein